MIRIPTIIILALIIDLIIGDPVEWPHPVKLMGKTINYLDNKLNHSKKIEGFYLLVILLSLVGLTSLIFIVIAYQFHFFLGILMESIIIATTISQKGLKEAAMSVYNPLNKNKIASARQHLSYIVGRDTESLEEKEIIRATVETIAENTTDGITAPIFWTVIGGAPAALTYRAINTCDSMLGYRNEKYIHFGWASAKLDDFVNYLPSRLTGIVMLYSARKNSVVNNISFKKLRKEAKKHSSPNSGWTEAANALLLGVELGGNNYYQGLQSKAVKIGVRKRSLEKNDIIKSIKIMQNTIFNFSLTIILGVLVYGLTQTWF